MNINIKKTLGIVLFIAIICGTFCSCGKSVQSGKSESVKNVETLISEIGEVTVDSEEDIKKAEKAFDALTDEEKGQVENADLLKTQREELDECLLEQMKENRKQFEEEKKKAAEAEKAAEEKRISEVEEEIKDFLGVWKPLYAEIALKDDYTSTFEEDTIYDDNITIDASNKTITKVDEKTINYGSIGDLELVEDNGVTKLIAKDTNTVFVREEEYDDVFNKIFVHVTLDENNIGDYIGGPRKIGKFLDEWGDESDTDAYTFSSPAYENGLIMLTYSDVKYEMFISGQSDAITYYAPYPIITGYGDPTLDHFGRAGGEIWYVRKEFVSELKQGETKNVNFGYYTGRVVKFSDGYEASFYLPAEGATNVSIEELEF